MAVLGRASGQPDAPVHDHQVRVGHVIAELYNPVSLRGLVKRLGPAGAVADGATEQDVYTRFDGQVKKLASVGDDQPFATRPLERRDAPGSGPHRSSAETSRDWLIRSWAPVKPARPGG